MTETPGTGAQVGASTEATASSRPPRPVKWRGDHGAPCGVVSAEICGGVDMALGHEGGGVVLT